ncbi:hypothetical protein HDU98_010041 [Podochytrium sp. JEL0797]|nr:hypothetical protein HDU98_010041 [Podochytrium sp. JEL0797]
MNGASLLRGEDMQTIMQTIGMGSATLSKNLSSPASISQFKVRELQPIMLFLTIRVKGHEATHNAPTSGIPKNPSKTMLVEYI